MSAALAIQILAALIGDFPEILADVKALIASIEGHAPATPQDPPIAPGIAADPLVSELQKPLAK